ncbi:DUF262 domain-containing protein [Curtobacterium sp. MCLR17_043]|uniref:DUF262 domain-containing protein n=1 Tax=Curtobacterium sp. MCLR17_043 TaxID=2175627 RepID=UPI000DA01CC6|nr:DUF262 domain-containing protein [Curtobacterium sp. MCLR17_043]PYY44009.1 DUF262 domain-containing protein [Curtobacterium sp. MCLR17_043]
MAEAREEDLIVQSSDMALMNVASLHSTGSLDLSPRYQRRNRWDRERQSQLIESFLLNVPVPPVYLAEESRGVFAVIDGKQRLTAIVQFINNEFSLTKLQLRRDLEGMRYRDLAADAASALGMRPLRAVTILRQTPDWVKHEVFVRLNRGGQPLNAQEIRNVAYAGPLNDRIIELAEDPFLHRQLKITSPDSAAYADMSDVETVVRFFALATQWRNFGGNLREALDRFMLEHHEAGPSRVTDLANRFTRALRWSETLWGQHAFQRHDGSQWRDQMIGGVFDAEMVAVDALTDKQLNALKPSRVLSNTRSLFTDPEFDGSVRLSTNTSARVRYRIEKMTALLEG